MKLQRSPIRNIRGFIGSMPMSDVNEQVPKGTLGGFVQTENNLSQEGTCWIYDEAICCENREVKDEAARLMAAWSEVMRVVTGDASFFDRAVAKRDCFFCGGELKEDAVFRGKAFVDTVGVNAPVLAGESHVYGAVCGCLLSMTISSLGIYLITAQRICSYLENGKRRAFAEPAKMKPPQEYRKDKKEEKSAGTLRKERMMPMTNGLSLEELMKEGTYPEEYAEGENWKILHGDTLKLVKAFQPGIFDAVITDPPYASGGTKQNERNRTTNQKYSSMSAANALPDFDGDNKDQRSWTHWMAEWLYDVRKACKKGAPICLFIDWRQYPSITDALQWAGWIWRGTAVWDKGNSRPQKGRFRQQAEYIVWGSNGPMPINRPVSCLPGVFRYGNPQNRIHVTEKPLQLMKDVIQICEPGGRILDPFAGAGTTILAAVEEGYEAVGIEVTDAYYKLGTDRVQFALNAAAGENDGQNA